VAYIDWWNRTGPVTLGERFGLDEISIARNTLSPTKSYTEDRIDMKPGGIVEPGVEYYAKTGPKVSPLPKDMEEWFQKDSPGKIWEEITAKQRQKAKLRFAGRNNPTVARRLQYEKLDDFLKNKIEKGEIMFEGNLLNIMEEANVELDANKVGKHIKTNYPNTFTYKNMAFEDIPNIESKIIELSKIKPPGEIYEQLIEEKIVPEPKAKKIDSKTIRSYMNTLKEEGKIDTILKDPKGVLTYVEQTEKDLLVKEFIEKNPEIDNAYEVARKIKSYHPDIKINSHYVENAISRLGLEATIIKRHEKIFDDIKTLDKIIKKSNDILLGEKIPATVRVKELIKRYAKETGKDIATATAEFGTRLNRLGSLYSGSGAGRYAKDLYKTIKAPAQYGGKFQANLIAIVDASKKLSNSDMARLLGLPEKEITLIDNMAAMMRSFPFAVAGDHMDIKALTKNLDNYKEHFTRIEYIKDTLNLYKRPYDIQIANLAKQVKGASPVLHEEILTKVKNLKNKFIKETGYDIGEFNIKNKKVFIDPKTPRLGNFKSPLNEALQQAMYNFENTMNPKKGKLLETKVSKFINKLDRKYMTANVKERISLLEKYLGTDIAKESQVLKAFQKVPRIGKIATAIIKGTAAATAISILASAGTTREKGITTEEMKKRKEGTLEPDDKKQEDRTAVFPYDIMSAIAKDPETAAVLGGATALGTVGPKKIIGGVLKAAEKAIRPLFVPAVDIGAAFVDTPITDKEHHRDVTSPTFWMTKAFWAGAMDKYGITRTFSMLKNAPNFPEKARILRDIALRGIVLNPKAVRAVSKIAWPATAAASVYDAYKDYQERKPDIEKVKELRKRGVIEEEEFDKDEPMFAMGGIASLMK